MDFLAFNASIGIILLYYKGGHLQCTHFNVVFFIKFHTELLSCNWNRVFLLPRSKLEVLNIILSELQQVARNCQMQVRPSDDYIFKKFTQKKIDLNTA